MPQKLHRQDERPHMYPGCGSIHDLQKHYKKALMPGRFFDRHNQNFSPKVLYLAHRLCTRLMAEAAHTLIVAMATEKNYEAVMVLEVEMPYMRGKTKVCLF
jgi:hypothetical protein